MKTHNFECRVPKRKEVCSPWLLNNVTTKSRDEFSTIKGLAFMTDAPMIEPYEQAEENRKKWFEDKQEEFVPSTASDKVPLLDYRSWAGGRIRSHRWSGARAERHR